MDNFGILESINNSVEFINLYSQENPILEELDICYFLFTNNIDYHRPLIAKGLIMEDKFTDGMNKLYCIRLLEIMETPKVILDFVISKPFIIFPYNNNILATKRLIQINESFNFNEYVFKIPAFFVRTNEEKIIELRNEYISVIKKDILKQLHDIDTL
jgi:hypothetical protein